MIKTPLFLVLEGIDGSGKSTQASLLHEYFLKNRIDAVKLCEPTNGKWGRQIREMLRHGNAPDPEKQNELFIRDREEDVKKNILPSLDKNATVIMDRYFYSNAAYQGASGLSPEAILRQNMEMGFPVPDRVYFIDISPRTAVERIRSRSSGSPELFERLEFLERVREIYLTFQSDNFIIEDGERPEQAVIDDIVNDLTQMFKK